MFASGLCTLLGILLILYVIPEQVMDSGEPVPNARTFPYVIASIFTLLSGEWCLLASYRWLKTKKSYADLRFLGLGLFLGACVVGVAVLIDWGGYIIGGMVATFLVFIAIEGREKWMRAALVSVLLVVCYALFFENVLNIEVPMGLLSFSSLFAG